MEALVRLRGLLTIALLGTAWVVPIAAWAQAGGGDAGSSCEAHLELAEQLLANNADSALGHALEVAERIQELRTSGEKVRALILVGDAHAGVGALPAALNAYQEAQQLVEEALEKEGAAPALLLSRSDIRTKIGLLYFRLRDLDKSLQCYNEALRQLAHVTGVGPEELDQRQVRLFNNIASVYVQRGDHATALPYFEQAAELNEPLHDPRNEGSLNNNIGICLMETGEYDRANMYFVRALAVREEIGDARGQAQVLNNLGKNEIFFGNFLAARDRFEQALAIGREVGSRESMAVSLESLALVQDTLRNYQAALSAHRAFKALNDSLYNTDSRLTIARLEQEFRRGRERDVLVSEARRLDADNARRRMWNITLGGALFFLALTAFLLVKIMRARVRNSMLEQEKLELEREKLEVRQIIMKDSLEFKDRELAANALFLLKKDELIAHIAERLLKAKLTFRQEDQQVIQEIVRELRSNQNADTWKEFEAHFTQVHTTFYQTLQERFPALTPNERKLCAFLRLNMSTKDIAAITQQTPNSITVARSRLRKKLHIEGEDVNLTDFLLYMEEAAVPVPSR